MFEEHKHFRAPADENAPLWRYMDFTKFMSILETESLFFARADRLGDRFEGSMPRLNATEADWMLPFADEAWREMHMAGRTEREKARRGFIVCNAISCWHQNEGESAAMWRLYLKSDEGIAIKSTYARLRDAVIDPEPVRIGLVDYVDYKTAFIDSSNMFIPLLHKRKSFEHEAEVRAIVTKFPGGDAAPWESPGILGAGVPVKVHLPTLIAGIQVAPGTQPWFSELVCSVCKRFGFEFEVAQSALDDQEMF